MSDTRTGGCLCGAVRYTVNGAPLMSGVCHCKNCQRQAGSAWSMLIGVMTDALSISGEPKTYIDQGDSGAAVHRQFCATCGSPLFSLPEAMPGMVFIKAGTLDDTADFAPTAQYYLKSKQAWVDLPGIPGFEALPG
ncbi:GFA family protein [Novosphingobium sp.]|uniref:GFA family protein n=1 Tax=Novosphingobium sp. TaxID=1874826 RepID=UPI0033427AE6